MSEHRDFAAYHGAGWSQRTGTLREDIATGSFWSSYSVMSEWFPLRDVMLYIPDADRPSPKESNRVQHLAPIDYKRLSEQLSGLAECYERLGVRVHRILPLAHRPSQRDHADLHNLMFARDLFWMTPEGAVIARMASTVRAGEEQHAAAALASLGVPIVRTMSGAGTFEGADALWLREDLVLIGLGCRTNQAGVQQIQALLQTQEVEYAIIQVPRQIQHLLGIVQIVDHDLAVIRGNLVPQSLKDLFRRHAVRMIELDETREVAHHQAMNFVVVSPRQIVMVAGNPNTRAILEARGLEVVAEVDVSELLKAAGGIGCATGILSRKP